MIVISERTTFFINTRNDLFLQKKGADAILMLLFRQSINFAKPFNCAVYIRFFIR